MTSVAETLARTTPGLATPLRHLAATLRRRLPAFVAILIACTALATGIGLMTPIRYSASARIVIDPRAQKVLPDSQMLENLNADPATIDSQVEILRSRALVGKVVEKLHLADDPEFDMPVTGGRGLRGLFQPAPPPPAERDREAARRGRVIDAVSNRLTVSNLGLSAVIQIGFQSESPTKAAAIANAFAQTYIDDQQEQKARANDQASSWLLSRLDQLRRNAEQSDAIVKRYEVEHGIVGLQSATGATANQQEIQSLTTELASARADEAAAVAKMSAAARAAAGNDSESAGSPVLQAYKKQRSELAARLADLQSRYGPLYPEVQSTRRELAEVERQIAGEQGSLRATLGTDARAAQARTARIAADLARATNGLQGANLASVGADALRKRADADRGVYEAFLNRYKQMSAQAGMASADARIISLATPPLKPGTPSLKLLALLGALVGAALGIVVIVGIDAIRGGVYTEDMLRDELGLTPLGALPEERAGRRGSAAVLDHVRDHPESILAETVRGVANAIALATAGGPHAVMIGSTVANEGKSTSAILIARALAGLGRRVLLVDCDVVKRSTSRTLAGDIPAGIVELVDGTAHLSDVVRADPEGAMDWIGVARDSRRAGVFGKATLPDILTQLKARYDIVVLDAAPLLATADARALAAQADRLLLAVRWQRTPRRAVRTMLRMLAAQDIRPMGALLTRVDLRRQARMGDADRYSYGAQYLAYTRG